MHLTADDVVYVHDRLIAEHGGTAGIANRRMVEFAADAASRKKDPVYEAAAILEFLAKNHPFLDGNEGTAFASAAAALRLEGRRVAAADEDATAFMLDVAANRLTLTQVATWLNGRIEASVGEEAQRAKAGQEGRPVPEGDAKRRAMDETLEAHRTLMKRLSEL
ncbi:MAG: Fic family protein [Nitrososphaerales archaeon]|jgi:death-on-curing protein